MQVSGKIKILVNDKPEFGKRIQYGFVKVKGMKENVFFNVLSLPQGTTFKDLKIGDTVRISVKQTSRGPFAESLTLSRQYQKKEISPIPELDL